MIVDIENKYQATFRDGMNVCMVSVNGDHASITVAKEATCVSFGCTVADLELIHRTINTMLEDASRESK